MNKISFFLVLLILSVMSGCITSGSNINITLLHTNDVHARLSQIDDLDQLCKEVDIELGKCYGGIARRFTKVNQIRKSNENVILLDAGDQFEGTLLSAKYHHEEAHFLMNRLGYQAMAVGNRELADGPENLARFAKEINFPLLSANLDVSGEPALKNVIKPFTIINSNGHKIGVIGLTTEETQNASTRRPRFKFMPVEASVIRAVEQLHAQGVRIIMVVSQSGFHRDLEIASRVNGVSVIVSGHTGTLLSNIIETAEGSYPTVVRAPNGEPVLIVSAYAYGKYLGHLDMVFDSFGQLVEWEGEPILLDVSVTEDPPTANLVARLRQLLAAAQKQ